MNLSNWRFAHASATGTAHIDQETECQDRFECSVVPAGSGDALIAVVADGAGSSTEGGAGAETACRLFVESITEFLGSGDASVDSVNAEFGRFWLEHFRHAISSVAEAAKKEIREYATTVVAAVAGPDSAVFIQVGDGAAVYSVSGLPGSYRFALPPLDAEYVNVTHFLTDDDVFERMRFARIDGRIEDLILFSDGIFPIAVDYRSNRPHEPFLIPMLAPLRNSPNGIADINGKLAGFLSSEKINEKTDDDKTIVLATRARV
jgi:hypothetical protein